MLDLLACGIDPERSTLYLQSDLPEVAEMALLLGMIAPLGWLERVPTYKERLRDMAERDVANFGLLGYPVLQTVDISIVRGELVPVGEDQVSHLEISREIVRRFNRLFGEILVEPQPLLSDFPLVPGSDGRKMSKSLDNAIGLVDDPDTIRAKVRSFITDPQKVRLGDPGRPEICPIFALHTRFSPDIVDWTRDHCRSGELGCVDCKTNLADRLIEELRPIRERRLELASEPGLVWKVWSREGARRPGAETMAALRDAMVSQAVTGDGPVRRGRTPRVSPDRSFVAEMIWSIRSMCATCRSRPYRLLPRHANKRPLGPREVTWFLACSPCSWN